MSAVHFFFFNDTATTEIYPLSLHDALPIFTDRPNGPVGPPPPPTGGGDGPDREPSPRRPVLDNIQLAVLFLIGGEVMRSEEHTSELQSQSNLVCRLLLEKKKKTQIKNEP